MHAIFRSLNSGVSRFSTFVVSILSYNLVLTCIANNSLTIVLKTIGPVFYGIISHRIYVGKITNYIIM